MVAVGKWIDLKMAANNVYTSGNIPKFDRGNICRYINELRAWQFVTKVEKTSKGLWCG